MIIETARAQAVLSLARGAHARIVLSDRADPPAIIRRAKVEIEGSAAVG